MKKPAAAAAPAGPFAPVCRTVDELALLLFVGLGLARERERRT
ncbi:hypothetical protein [Geobacillus thermoleovorans]|nr:hypothetical protein [Geobacillus thermoleovorans]